MFLQPAANISHKIMTIFEYQVMKLKSALCKIYGRHQKLIDRYGISVPKIIADMFQMSYLQFQTLFSECDQTELDFNDYRVCSYKRNTMGATCLAGSVYTSGAPEISPSLWEGLCCSVFSFLCCGLCVLLFACCFLLFCSALAWSVWMFLWYLSPLFWMSNGRSTVKKKRGGGGI